MTGKNAKAKTNKAPSVPFRAADYLKSEEDIAGYLAAALEDGDSRVITVALRNAADAIGGMSELARQADLSRETLYRTLSPQGNPRLDTLAKLLAVFNLRLAVEPINKAA